MSIHRSLSQPVRAIERSVPTDTEMIGWLERVGHTDEVLPGFPHHLSGGQLQRVGWPVPFRSSLTSSMPKSRPLHRRARSFGAGRQPPCMS